MGGTARERGWNGAGKGYFMADKKPRKYFPHQPRLSAPPAFIRSASLFHARCIYLRRKCLSVPQAFSASTAHYPPRKRFYPCRTPFFSAHRVYPRRKRLPLAVFPANETPRAHTRGVSL